MFNNTDKLTDATEGISGVKLSEYCLVIDNICKTYSNGVRALNNVCFKVKSKSIFCLLGANGAGKSTLINLMFDLLNPDSGDILIEGISVREKPVLAKQKASYVCENVILYKSLTGRENLEYFLALRKIKLKSVRYKDLLDVLNFPPDALNRRASTYSKGMMQKIGLLIALVAKTPLIVLDEPTSGLDPYSAHELMNIFVELKKLGHTIFMSTHDVFRVREIADCVAVLKKGELVYFKEFESETSRHEIDFETLAIKYIV